LIDKENNSNTPTTKLTCAPSLHVFETRSFENSYWKFLFISEQRRCTVYDFLHLLFCVIGIFPF